jgi:hypothetical protein
VVKRLVKARNATATDVVPAPKVAPPGSGAGQGLLVNVVAGSGEQFTFTLIDDASLLAVTPPINDVAPPATNKPLALLVAAGADGQPFLVPVPAADPAFPGQTVLVPVVAGPDGQPLVVDAAQDGGQAGASLIALRPVTFPADGPSDDASTQFPNGILAVRPLNVVYGSG